MAQQTITISNGVNIGTGDTLRLAFGKVNNNFGQFFNTVTINSTVTTLTLTNTTSTFANNVIITGQVTINSDLAFTGNVTGTVDGGAF